MLKLRWRIRSLPYNNEPTAGGDGDDVGRSHQRQSTLAQLGADVDSGDVEPERQSELLRLWVRLETALVQGGVADLASNAAVEPHARGVEGQ